MPERRASECRGGRDGGDHYVKTDDRVTEVRAVKVPERATDAALTAAERAAPQHTEDAVARFQVLPPVVRVVRILEFRFSPILSP